MQCGANSHTQTIMKLHSSSTHLIASCIATLALTACGGGGGGGTPVSPQTSAVTDTAPSTQNNAPEDMATAAAVRDSTGVAAVVPVSYGSGWIAPSTQAYLDSNIAPNANAPVYTPVFTGTGYYVDVITGNDNNPGTIDAPWRTLVKASAAPLRAGDALLLKCGSVWRDSLELTTSNLREGDYLIGGYGDCSGNRRPIIRASDWIPQTGWNQVAGETRPIYNRTQATEVTRLFINSIPQVPARYPNFRGVGAEFAIASSTGSKQSIKLAAADLATLSTQDLIGATIHVKVTQWQFETAKIQTVDTATGVITFDHALPFVVKDGSGFILEGKRWMLDAPGEWYYDVGTKGLLIWTPDGTSPANFSGMEAAVRDYGLTVKWAKNVRIERIRVEQQAQDGIRLIETPNAVISDVVALHVKEHGISVVTAADVTIKNAWVLDAGRRGILARETPNIQVLNNIVQDNGGFGRIEDTDSAVDVLGVGALIKGNLIERSASVGIHFANRPNVVIEDNTIYQPCLRFTDCGGIYTWTATAPTPPVTAYVARAMVRNNIIVSSRSNLEGCGYSCKNLATGIYLDDMSSGATLQGNTISDTEIGIGIHNGHFNILSGNVIRNVSFAVFRIMQTRTDNALTVGNQFLNNSLVSSKTMALVNGLPADTGYVHAFYWFHTSDPTVYFTKNNTVLSGNTILSTQKNAEATWAFTTWTTNKPLFKADWKVYAPTDTSVSRVVYRPFVATTEANLLKNGGFSSAITNGWSTYFDPEKKGGSFTLGKFAPCGTVDCGRQYMASDVDQLFSSPIQLNTTAGQNLYVFRLSAVAGAAGGPRKAAIRRAVSPWENYGLSTPSVTLAPGESLEQEQYFLAKMGDPGVLDLHGSAGSETFIRSASVNRVASVEFATPNKQSIHVLNPTTTDLTFPCIALKISSCDVVDEDGDRVVFPLVVPARGSVQVFARDTKWMIP
jgi:parallel beta-helix repeat protein